MIQSIDLKEVKQSIARVMTCQLKSGDFDWNKSVGLYHLIANNKLSSKIDDFLKVARHHSVDLIIFPELSIHEIFIQKIQSWSKEQGAIVVCGSHYYENNGRRISRCPIIINGSVYFTEKLYPAPIEKSPLPGEGIVHGEKVLKFENTKIGNFAVLICSDYLEDSLKKSVSLDTLDILCVCAFQKNSDLYHNRMNIDCETSDSGLYIYYSNFLDGSNGDGNSSVFGLMDKLFTEKIKVAGFSNLMPNTKLFQFNDEMDYLISDVDLVQKRPYANRTIHTDPNFKIIATSALAKNKHLSFLQKITHDDERYKRIDELFVPPTEYQEILNTLSSNNIIFIIGDPGIGKTYTAVKILKDYYDRGYEPTWFVGLEKEEREAQSRALTNFTPTENHIVYFEDPFGRTTFERRDTLFQVFSPLMDQLKSINSKIIVTSRKEIFETFTSESLLESELYAIKKELNVRNPSYNSEKLCAIFDRLAEIVCAWYENKEYRHLVYEAINSGKITTPLAIRDLVYVTKDIQSISLLTEQIDRRGSDITKVFALEILNSSLAVKTILCTIYLCGSKGKPYIADLYQNITNKLSKAGFANSTYSFNLDLRSQIGYRIEQFGYTKSAFRFSHPVYEESLSTLIVSDRNCYEIARVAIHELIKKDTKYTFTVLNNYAIKYPDVVLMLYNHILESKIEIGDDKDLKLITSQKLISTYYTTQKEEFFNLALHFYPLNALIKDINGDFSDWGNLVQKFNLCLRYVNNSPLEFDSSLADTIDWEKLFSYKNDNYFSATKLLRLLTICSSLDPSSITIFMRKKGTNILKKTYLLLHEPERGQFYRLFKGLSIQKDFRKFRKLMGNGIEVKKSRKFGLFKSIIFAEKKYFGKIVIDKGASLAISKPWVNLLPAGILQVIGHFSSGTIVGIFEVSGQFIAVGIVEFSSEELAKIMGHQSGEFQELLGYYHTTSAIKNDLLLRFRDKRDSLAWNQT